MYPWKPDIKSKFVANKYANTKIKSDKACYEMVKICDTYGSTKGVDDTFTFKISTEVIHQYNKDNPNKKIRTNEAKNISPKINSPSLVVTNLNTQVTRLPTKSSSGKSLQ